MPKIKQNINKVNQDKPNVNVIEPVNNLATIDIAFKMNTTKMCDMWDLCKHMCDEPKNAHMITKNAIKVHSK